jgi:hypothetical protein
VEKIRGESVIGGHVPARQTTRKLSELSLSSFIRQSKDWFSSKRYFAQWWWVSTQISALGGQKHILASAKNSSAGMNAKT